MSHIWALVALIIKIYFVSNNNYVFHVDHRLDFQLVNQSDLSRLVLLVGQGH